MRNFNGQIVHGYTFENIDANAFLDQCHASVKDALLRSESAFANVLPEILVADQQSKYDAAKRASVIKLDNGSVAVEKDGVRFKVVTSKNDRFNVAPSFTKGYGRSDFGVSAKAYLSRYYDYVILANVSDKSAIKCKRIKVADITDNTVKVASE